MPNEEKKWRMYKKAELIPAVREVEFTDNIIPKFEGSEQATDSWGTWTLFTNKGSGSLNYVDGDLWNVADHDETTSSAMRYHNSGMAGAIEIYLPEGVSICPKQIGITVTDKVTLIYFYGYDPVEKSWVKLVDSSSFGIKSNKVTTPNPSVTTSDYFTKFRWDVRTTNSVCTPVAEIKILQGIIKNS